MLRVPVDQLKPGMVLARPVPVPNEPSRLLLGRDFKVTDAVIPRLKQLGIQEVWTRFKDLEFLENVIDTGLHLRQRELYDAVRRNFEGIMRGAEMDLEFGRFSTMVSDLIDYVKGSRAGTVLLEKLDAFDNYLLSHSANVCYLSLLLGLKLERYLVAQRPNANPAVAKDVQHLGLGSLLHDVGKTRIARTILDKPTRLTSDEMEEMQRHPIYGYEMVRHDLPALAAQVVLNHHQRWDGSGYPQPVDRISGKLMPPLGGHRIPVFCRICSVVDVYDAATSQRVYSDAKLPVEVLYEMRGDRCRGQFDPVVRAAFFEIVPPFPIGTLVTLSSGEQAAVVEHNPSSPYRPHVKLLRDPSGEPLRPSSRTELNLAETPDLHVAKVGDVDVRPFLCEEEEADGAEMLASQSSDTPTPDGESPCLDDLETDEASLAAAPTRS